MTGRGPIIRILGPVEVVGDSGEPVRVGGRKQATVLVALALSSGTWVPTERLAGLVWPDREPPVSAANNLKTYVWQLRRLLDPVLGAGRIESRAGGYRLRLAPGELDADHLQASADRVGALLRDRQAAAVVELVPPVLALWRGRPYDEVAGHCSHPSFARLAEQRSALREALAEAYVQLGRPLEAIELLTAVTAEDPMRELAWARLIDALRQAGRVREALAAYQKARLGLVRELGVDPGPELAAAHQAVLGAERASSSWPLPRQLPRPASVAGRGQYVRALLDAARTGRPSPVLVVSGPAGAGKTAVVVLAGHALADRYRDGQLFLDGGVGVGDALARLIRSVAGPGLWLPDSVDERAALWRSVSHGKRLLVVLDGVRDAAQLEPLLPAASGCLVLATSRNRISGIDGTTEIRLTRGAGLVPVSVADDGTWVA